MEHLTTTSAGLTLENKYTLVLLLYGCPLASLTLARFNPGLIPHEGSME